MSGIGVVFKCAGSCAACEFRVRNGARKRTAPCAVRTCVHEQNAVSLSGDAIKRPAYRRIGPNHEMET